MRRDWRREVCRVWGSRQRWQLYSPAASDMHECVICPLDVICASRVKSCKANIISLRGTAEQYHCCKAIISLFAEQRISLL